MVIFKKIYLTELHLSLSLPCYFVRNVYLTKFTHPRLFNLP